MPPMLFWDNDGVLLDSERWYFQASADILLERGVSLGEEAFRELSLVQGRSLFDLLGPEVDAATVEQLRQRRNQRFTEYLLRGGHLIEGVAEVLAELAPHHRMAVVTGSKREHFEAGHRDSGILGYFDFVITLEDAPRGKPQPDPYLVALGRAGVLASEAVAIEDSPRGARSAILAGIRCLAIPRHGGDFPGAAAILSDVREVPGTLGRLARGEKCDLAGTRASARDKRTQTG
jgi:HAD superfamily hydrolase (TIGR01509 family)